MRQHYATSDSLQEVSFASHVLDVSGFNPTPQADLDESLPGPLWKLYCATCDWDVRWSRERGGGSETAAPWTRKLMEFCISPGASPTHAIHVGTYFASAQEEKGSMKRGEAPACHGLAEASVTWLFLCRGCLLEGKYASDIRRNSLLTPHSITCQLPLDPASSPIFFSWPDLNTRAGSAFSGLLDLGTIARLPVVVGSLRFAGPEQYGEVASSLGLAGAENEARWLDC